MARHPLSGRPDISSRWKKIKINLPGNETSGRAAGVCMGCRGEIRAVKKERPAWLPTRLRKTEAG